ncbi:hypothetical protein [Microbacterium testaceum]|uniref:hypothetical protein n=1 Tax=Microbacterium testaceum TaxID=2033 RepID=UPI0002E216E6|nr:hypothetical protein [Microbacterium testaceum]
MTTTWSVASLFAAVGAAVAIPVGVLSGPPSAAWGAYVLLLAAELLLLATMILTLGREDAFEGVESLARVPAVLAWPLRVGCWIGGLVASLATVVMVVSAPSTEYPSTGSRVALSLMAAVTLVAALFTGARVPGVAVGVLAAVAGLVVLIGVVRGVVGLVARASR